MIGIIPPQYITHAMSVSVTTNLALNKPSTQSSTSESRVASYAVDGIYGVGNFAQTNNDPLKWWRVDLKDVYSVERIKLYNRVDYCKY